MAMVTDTKCPMACDAAARAAKRAREKRTGVFGFMPAILSAQALRLPVGENLPRRVPSRRAGDPAAGMRPGAAQVEAAHGGAVARPAGERPPEEELPQVEIAVEDVPFGQAEALLEIDRRHDVARHDRAPE